MDSPLISNAARTAFGALDGPVVQAAGMLLFALLRDSDHPDHPYFVMRYLHKLVQCQSQIEDDEDLFTHIKGDQFIGLLLEGYQLREKYQKPDWNHPSGWEIENIHDACVKRSTPSPTSPAV